jgi:hypothetical protein
MHLQEYDLFNCRTGSTRILEKKYKNERNQNAANPRLLIMA